MMAVREPSRVRHAAQFRAVACQLAAETRRGATERTLLRRAGIPAAVCPHGGLTASINTTARIIALPPVHATFHSRTPAGGCLTVLGEIAANDLLLRARAPDQGAKRGRFVRRLINRRRVC